MPFPIPKTIKRIFAGHAFVTQRVQTPQGSGAYAPLPSHYTPHDACAEFLAREARARGKRFHFIQAQGAFGLMWHYGPLRFARFFTDTEPQWPSNLRPPHFLFWQPISRTDIPKPWHVSQIAIHQSRIGFALLHPDRDPLAHISSHAQRHVRAWRKKEWVIEPIPVHAYWDIAFRSTLRKSHTKAFNAMLTEKIAGHGERVHILGARPKNSSVYEAGFAYVDIPETRTSLHHVSCVTPLGRDAHAGTGLMAWWLNDLHARGFAIADFGLFYTEGEPENWKGFSQFKAQFCTHMHDFPALLIKRRRSV